MSRNQRRDHDTTPTLPVSTPPASGAPDNWTMQALVDLKVAVVAMDTSIKALTEQIGELKTDHAKSKSKLANIEKQIYAATAVVVMVMGVGGFLANKAIDFGLDMAKKSVPVLTIAPVAPAVPASPAGKK